MHARHLQLPTNAKGSDIARFRDWYATNKFTMVWYHATWCGHCDAMVSDWKKFVTQALAKHSNLYIVDMMDTEMRRSGMDHEAEAGFPTVRMYHKGQLQKEFDGARDVTAWLSFAAEHCDKDKKSGGYRVRSSKNRVRSSKNRMRSSKNRVRSGARHSSRRAAQARRSGAPLRRAAQARRSILRGGAPRSLASKVELTCKCITCHMCGADRPPHAALKSFTQQDFMRKAFGVDTVFIDVYIKTRGQHGLYKALWAHSINPGVPGHGNTALYSAVCASPAEADPSDVVKRILFEYDPRRLTTFSQHPLPPINARMLSKPYSTALHTAAFNKKDRIVEMLLIYGANPHIINEYGKTSITEYEGRDSTIWDAVKNVRCALRIPNARGGKRSHQYYRIIQDYDNPNSDIFYYFEQLALKKLHYYPCPPVERAESFLRTIQEYNKFVYGFESFPEKDGAIDPTLTKSELTERPTWATILDAPFEEIAAPTTAAAAAAEAEAAAAAAEAAGVDGNDATVAVARTAAAGAAAVARTAAAGAAAVARTAAAEAAAVAGAAADAKESAAAEAADNYAQQNTKSVTFADTIGMTVEVYDEHSLYPENVRAALKAVPALSLCSRRCAQKLRVKALTDGGEAAQKGVRLGDQLLTVDGHYVNCVHDVEEAFETLPVTVQLFTPAV